MASVKLLKTNNSTNFIVTLGVTSKDVKLAERIAPDSLELRNSKDRVVFRLGVAKEAHLSEYGLSIPESKGAEIKVQLPTPETDNDIINAIGVNLQANLAKIEEAVKAALAASKATVLEEM